MKFNLLLLFIMAVTVHGQNLNIKLTSPAKNAEFEACSDIKLAADASVTDGTIRRVEFYSNGSKIKALGQEPYEYIWKEVPDGIYKIHAKVVDTDRNEALTSPIFIFVGNVEPGNIIINGEFNCDLAPWRLDNYEGGESTIQILPDLLLTDDSSGVVIDIQNQGNYFWSIQLMQPFEVEEGHVYTISFTAMADEPKDMAVHISKNYGDYAPIFAHDLQVYDWQEYGPIEFHSTVTDDNLMFKFILGGNDISLFLDAVKVMDSGWTGVKQTGTPQVSSFQLLQNVPNPFNPTTRIEYVLEKAGDIELSIYDVLGQQVYTFSRFEQAGRHRIEWNGRTADGSVCPSGVYFYQLRTATGTLTKKMHLVR